jgi:ADP-ribosylation factor-like protein 2
LGNLSFPPPPPFFLFDEMLHYWQVVDSADRWRLEECRNQLREILSQEVIFISPLLFHSSICTLCLEQKLAGASLLIFANKQDLGGALSVQEISEVLQLHADDISGRHWTIFGCSAVTGEGLEDGVDWIVKDIASRIFMMS